MENVQYRAWLETIKKNADERIIRQQSKLTFSGIHKSYTIYDCYTFKQKEVVLIDKPHFLRVAI